MAQKGKGGIRRLFSLLGPGLIAGTADDDPAGITTYSQAGAAFQYGLLWTVLLQIPLMSAVQLMCAQIGQVAGEDLARVIERHYPRALLWAVCVLLVFANTVTAAADLAGMSAGLALLTHLPTRLFVPIFAVGIGALLVFLRYARIRVTFKWLTLALLAYFVAGVLANPNWLDVLRRSVVPGIEPSRKYLATFVAVFGTTISPYLFIWQSAEEVEEQRAQGETTLAQRRGATDREIRDERIDTISGMAISQVIGFFIMVSAGAILFPSGVHDIQSARDAAQALHPIGGGIGTVLFAVGFIGTGMLAVPTLVGGSAYAIAALGRWRASINDPFRRSRAFYLALLVSLAVAAGLGLSGVSPVTLLFGSAVVNGILTPPLLVVVMLITNRRGIMGQRTNGWILNALGVITLILMGGASLWLAAWYAASKILG